MTLASCHNAEVYGNYFEDNTDVDLIVGPGQNCHVYDNEIVHYYRYGYAGLMIGFDGSHETSVVSGNSVVSGMDQLSIGLMVGHDPWKDVPSFHAGTISGNVVDGAVTLLWVDGLADGTVEDNVLSNRRGTRQLFDCQWTDDYSAGDFGAATLQPGWLFRSFNNGSCQ